MGGAGAGESARAARGDEKAGAVKSPRLGEVLPLAYCWIGPECDSGTWLHATGYRDRSALRVDTSNLVYCGSKLRVGLPKVEIRVQA